MTKTQRARHLLALVTNMIETGEFTMSAGYLKEDPKWGPCGCAIAGAAFALGLDPAISAAADGSGEAGTICRNQAVRSSLLSETEARLFEAGYEEWDADDYGGPAEDFSKRDPFYEAGKNLRQYKHRPEITPDTVWLQTTSY